jgi:hypothetical protein
VLARLSGKGQRRELSPEGAARFAIGAARHISDESHTAVLGLIDELIAVGAPRSSDQSVGMTRAPARIEREPVEIS